MKKVLFTVLAGMVLAIVVMILSVAIVMGFKGEIANKIYALDPHMKVWNAVVGLDDNYSTVNGREVMSDILEDSVFKPLVNSMALIADKPAILKTDSDFMGIQYKGVSQGYDWQYIEQHLVDGRVPNMSDTANIAEIVVSRTVAQQLRLHVGEKVPTYFIDEKVKVRNPLIVGIFNTDFDSFDKAFVVGNIALIQQVNGWNADTGNYVGVNLKRVDNIENDAYTLYSLLARATYDHASNTLFTVNHTKHNNLAFFSWLGMLDMNVAVILALMMVVAGFTLISALLMIVLERIKMSTGGQQWFHTQDFHFPNRQTHPQGAVVGQHHRHCAGTAAKTLPHRAARPRRLLHALRAHRLERHCHPVAQCGNHRHFLSHPAGAFTHRFHHQAHCHDAI